jgi:hypothetical protein
MEHQHSQKWWAKLDAPSWGLIHFPFAARIKGSSSQNDGGHLVLSWLEN